MNKQPKPITVWVVLITPKRGKPFISPSFGPIASQIRSYQISHAECWIRKDRFVKSAAIVKATLAVVPKKIRRKK